MSKKTLLSTLLISSFSLSTVFAADTLAQTGGTPSGNAKQVWGGAHPNTATNPELSKLGANAEPTVMKFTSSSNVPLRALAINDQTCEGFPFTRTAENNADQIMIRNSVLPVIDPWFFQGNTSLKKVSFEGSTVDFTPFAGHTFLIGCDSIEAVSFKGTTGVDLATFLEQYASPTLLQRILDRKCKLFIDMAETGTTMANFAKDGVVTQDAIHFAIRTAKILEVIAKENAATAASSTAAPAKGWLSTFTFGYLGQ